jgi:hypothetical protein
MKRTISLLVILLIFVMAHWIITMLFWGHMPAKMPLNIPDAGYPVLGDRIIFMVFPAISTAVAALIAALFPFRKKLPCPAVSKVSDLPQEYGDSIRERFFQILSLAAIFIGMMLAYWQTNLALYTIGRLTQFRATALWASLAIMVFYLGYNLFSLYRSTDSLRAIAKQNKSDSPTK